MIASADASSAGGIMSSVLTWLGIAGDGSGSCTLRSKICEDAGECRPGDEVRWTLRRLGEAPMPMGAMRGLPRGDARRSNGDAAKGGEGSSDGADGVDADTGADVGAVVVELGGDNVRVGAISPARANASFSACPIPSCWPPNPSSFFPFTKMLSPSVVVVSSASLARGAPGECGVACCGDIVQVFIMVCWEEGAVLREYRSREDR